MEETYKHVSFRVGQAVAATVFDKLELGVDALAYRGGRRLGQDHARKRLKLRHTGPVLVPPDGQASLALNP